MLKDGVLNFDLMFLYFLLFGKIVSVISMFGITVIIQFCTCHGYDTVIVSTFYVGTRGVFYKHIQIPPGGFLNAVATAKLKNLLGNPAAIGSTVLALFF